MQTALFTHSQPIRATMPAKRNVRVHAEGPINPAIRKVRWFSLAHCSAH